MDTKGTVTFWVTWWGFVLGGTALLVMTFMLVLTPLTSGPVPGAEEQVQDIGYLTDMLGHPLFANLPEPDLSDPEWRSEPQAVLLDWNDGELGPDWWDVQLEESALKVP